jgi:hypothetical protein
VPKYIYDSPPFYQEEHENEKLEKKLKILNLKFIMWLSKKLQLKASKRLEELN